MKYEFPPYTLLPEQRQLLRDGAPIKLGGRAFDVLLALVDRRDRTVSKNELMDLVWPTVVVEENNLEVQIVTLRKLLGHPAIATVPGRGYRFAVPLATDISLEPSQSSEVAAQGAEPRIAKSGYVPLPRPGSVLVGRLRDQEVVMSLLLRHRLVTLTGTGGIGKTRLAIEAARKQTTIPDVAWADLSSATTPDRVPIVMATALDVAIEDASEAVARIITALQHRPAVLLVVDNAEHQIEATAAVVGALVAGAEGLSVLTTSREPLRIDGEVTYTLGGLEMPNENVPASEAHRFEAVSLFVDRLRAAGGRFRLDDDATADVVALCRMLNGMPLAIELAAARAPTLGLKRLRSVLRDNLVVLSSNRRDIPARQLTMRATLEWSYRLLNAAEQSAFRKAGVFAGGFTIDAFCAVAADEGADDWERVDLLESLVDKSLVTVNGEEPPRYALLETTRIYALEQLKQHDEWNRARQAHALYFTTYFAREMDDAQRRHAEHFRRFFDDPNEAREETARPRVARADGSNAGRSAYGSLGDARRNWLSHYRSEWENLITALEWADRTAAPDLFCPLFNAAARIAPEAGDSVVVRRYVDTACAIAHNADPRTASELLRSVGGCLGLVSNRRALEAYRAAVEKARVSGDCWLLYRSLVAYARLLASGSNLTSLEFVRAVIDEARALEDPSWPVTVRATLRHAEGGAFAQEGDIGKARACYLEALALHTEARSASGSWWAKLALMDVEARAGNDSEAIRLGEALLPGLRASRSQVYFPIAILCGLYARQGKLALARAAASEALQVVRSQRLSVAVFAHIALFVACEGRLADAARLLGYTDASLRSSSHKLETLEEIFRNEALTLIAGAMRPAELERMMAEGELLGDFEADAIALSRNESRDAPIHAKPFSS